MEISDTGFWNTQDPQHWFDKRLCHFISSLIKRKSIKTLVDFGCGDCSYIKSIINGGVSCEGYDGNPFTSEVSSGFGRILDLSTKVELGKKFDCVLSLETGEHIPKEFEQIFFNNIVNHSNNLIIISWAIPGQGGNGHFNERENRYVISEIEKRNFKLNKKESLLLRNQSSIYWFK